MPTVQVLKKKLRGVQTTRKISKAMKTAATVKYSRLSAVYSGYSKYAKQCEALYGRYGKDFLSAFPELNEDAPVCYIVMASNKGMCGSFNHDLFDFAEKILCKDDKEYDLIVCGEKAKAFFDNKSIRYIKDFTFNDVPSFSEAENLYNELIKLIEEKGYSSVKIIYQHYVNMMKQTPAVKDLFGEASEQEQGSGEELFIPDKATVIKKTAESIISATIYGLVLGTAIGAQAATVMNMRSAYDTATEYEEQLESEINRKRQSQVTADVIETSAEFSQEEE